MIIGELLASLQHNVNFSSGNLGEVANDLQRAEAQQNTISTFKKVAREIILNKEKKDEEPEISAAYTVLQRVAETLKSRPIDTQLSEEELNSIFAGIQILSFSPESLGKSYRSAKDVVAHVVNTSVTLRFFRNKKHELT